MLKPNQTIQIMPDPNNGFWELGIITSIDPEGYVECVYFNNREKKVFSFMYQGYQLDKQVRAD